MSHKNRKGRVNQRHCTDLQPQRQANSRPGTKQICYDFLSKRGCGYGANCRFSHDPSNAPDVFGGVNTPSSNSDIPIKFRLWTSLIPRPSAFSSSRGVDTAKFFKLGWELIERNDPGTSQSIVIKLATDEGLAMIRAMTDIIRNRERLKVVEVFKMAISPFFQMISHPYVLSSPILEAPLDTICAFLFGPNGRRTIDVFGVSADALKELLENDSVDENEQLERMLTASLQVLQRIIDLNQTAQIIQEVSTIANNIADLMPTDRPLQAARKTILRIQQRLGIKVQTNKEKEQEYLQNVVFDINHDLPGNLSIEGQRHDNDHEDIMKIRILPTMDEIRSDRPEYLPPSSTNSGHIQGMAKLLDRQFRLFREDIIAPIRDVIRAELNEGKNGSGRHIRTGIRYFVYQDARLQQLRFDAKRGLLVVVEFDQPPAVTDMSARQRRDWWERTKQLSGDSLVCFISSAGRAIFFQVFNPHPIIQKTETGEDSEDPDHEDKYRRAASLFKDEGRASITLAMVEPSEEDIMWMTTHLESPQTLKLHQSLLEFPGVLLPAFQPTLQALQKMSQSPTTVPFSELLASETMTLHPPPYTQTRNFSFNLEAITNGKSLTFTPGRVFDHQEMHKMATLDGAQQISVMNALSRCFALIQGPPGTGKSYTGVSIIKVLLTNRDKANLGPILCVCYTNHALDQLLEHLLKSGVEQIVRIGSRSRSPLIQGFNLFDLSRRYRQTKAERYLKAKCYSDLDEELNQIMQILRTFQFPNVWQNIQEYLAGHPRHYEELFPSRIDNNGFQKVEVKPNKAIKRWLKGKAQDPSMNRPVSDLLDVSLWEMSRNERKRLYNHWVEGIVKDTTNKLLNSLDEHRKTKDRLDKCHQEVQVRCLEQAHVIGVTVTGLARNIDMLRRISAKVLVCEEAGEVLEAQMLTALLPSIEHAILIGDHEQLRPQIHSYELQHDHPSGKEFSLDVSLFERLINPKTGSGKIPFCTLRTQRRMHPSIAELVRSTIYPQLEDHPSVHEYPGVSGMRDRLFWLNHQQKESGQDSPQTNGYSKTNLFEVEMVNALVSHLVRQGTYAREDIAVITPYLGQLQKLRERLGRAFEIVVAEQDLDDLENQGLLDTTDMSTGDTIMRKRALVHAVRLATVDNFQGEEAKVIVVSLVRSNDEKKCGFLKSSNRINVLLSRAKHGMYIVGNAETARSVPMWADILSMLERNGQIGPQLALCCSRHPGILINVSTPDHFVVLSPEGGCNRKCNSRLKCGHKCINMCHSESLHNAVRCLERCLRPRKGCNHPCPHVCGDPCERYCQARVSGAALKCGHTPASLKCYQAQNPESYRCQVPTETVAPICGHKVMIPCGRLPLKDNYKCMVVCGRPLPCGHTCANLCKDCKPADGNNNFKHGVCKVECGRAYKTCSHTCGAACHGESPCPLCEKPCEIRCAHSQCGKKCHEPCAPCAEECTSTCPHREKCQLPCAVPCDALPCSKRCLKQLTCGHQCPSICGEKCPDPPYCQVCADQSIKQAVVDYIMGTAYEDLNLDENPCIVPPCGHIISVESLDAHQGMKGYYVFSEEPGKENMIVGMKPAEPLTESESKRCPVCRGPLNDIQRYVRILKRRWIDEATKKFIAWAHSNFLPLADEIMQVETKLRNSQENEETNAAAEALSLELRGPNNEQINKITKLVRLDRRYQEILRLRRKVWQFLAKVDESEQPFQRIHALVEDVRKQRGIATDLKGDPTLLQVRHRLMTTLLLFRCDYAIICQFLNVSVREAGSWVVTVDFSINRKYCEKLVAESQQRTQPAIAVEGHIFWARFAALECGGKEGYEELSTQARDHLRLARNICEQFPGQTGGLVTEVEDVTKMLQESTFYLPVSNEERAEVYAAMALELRGTGHWYYCANGHPFTIGECGMPMEEAMCPQCGSLVGGRQHEIVPGVTQARDLDDQFAR